jgi:hypothetical protein
MAQDFNTMTPGSAVADTLQEILARKRAEARQAMLDDITQKESVANMEYRRENMLGLKEQREATSEQRQALGAKTRFDQQQRVEQDAARKNFLASPDFAQLDPKYQTAIRFAIQSGNNTGVDDIIKQMVTPEHKGKLIQHDEATGAFTLPDKSPFTGELGQYDKVVTRNRPPQGPRDFAPVPFAGTGEDGKPAYFGYFPGSNEFKPATVPDNTKIAGRAPTVPGAGTQVKLPLTPAEVKAYADARGLATEPTSWGQPPVKEKDRVKFQQYEQSIKSKFPPDIVAIANEIMQMEDPSIPIDQVIAHAIQNGSVDAAEAPILGQYLSLIR